MKHRSKSWLVCILSILLVASLAACSTSKDKKAVSSNSADSAGGDSSSNETVTLKFTFWGSAFEKQGIEKMVKSFEEKHPNIKIDAQQIAGDYDTKMNTLMASNELPDVAYLHEELAMKWAEQGKLLDIAPYLQQYPQLANRLPQTYFYYEPGKTIGTSLSAESINLFYNKELFKESGVETPPTTAETAWTWDKFVETAQRLTKDKNGKSALDPDFDPNNIVQYGVSFPTYFYGWYPFLKSNGADITNDDGTQFTMNSPEAVEVFQKLQDLMYKYHVAPSATQQQNLPATSVSLQTKKVAIAIDGQWNVLDFASSKLHYGVGVLPKLKVPKTIITGAPAVIFSTTKHPKEAMEFYLYYNDPQQVDLYAKGLWMPLELKYYTEQEFIDQWTKNDAHPPEYKEAVIDYTVKNADRSPAYFIKNWGEISPKLAAGLDNIWTNNKSAQDTLDELAKTIQPLLQGKYPDR